MSFSYSLQGDQTKPALIFLHGFMGQKEDWQPIINELEKDFYCMAMDLPGHGESPLGDFQSFNEVAQDLINFIKEKLPEKKVGLIGYSLGGRLALSMLLEVPSLFSLAVLESCNPGIEDESKRLTRLQADQKLFQQVQKQDDLKQFFDKWYSLPLFGNIKNHSDYNQLIKKKLTRNYSKWQSSLNFLSIGCQKNHWPRLKDISVPTLYIHGEYDEKYSQIAKRMKEINSNFRLQHIDKAAHNTHFERPENFLEHLKDFIYQ